MEVLVLEYQAHFQIYLSFSDKLINETRGVPQQHLQLTTSQATSYQRIRTIIIEHYRAATSLCRMQQLNGEQPRDDKGLAPMGIGATWKGKSKGKGKKGHHKVWG